MSDVREEVEALISERPALEESLREVLEIDRNRDTWEFDDVPLDSGTFGEIVSRGVVESADHEYRLANADAVATAIDAEDVSEDGVKSRSPDLDVEFSPSFPAVDRRFVATLVGVLALIVLFRIVPYPSVFRGADVVLSANDPYFYRYHVERSVEALRGPFDIEDLSGLSNKNGEPLLIATLWFVAVLLGGQSTVGLVLAWYPVVAGLVSAWFVYAIAARVTDDPRVGLAAVFLLAVTPAHAFRTGLGFADHHAFDYVWLALTAWALVAMADRNDSDWQKWALSGVLGIGIAGQTLAWDASPLMLIPLGLYIAEVVPSAVRGGKSPVKQLYFVTVGITVGAILSYLAHSGFGWHTSIVAYAPTLLLGGVLGVVAVGETAHRLDIDVRTLVGIEAVGIVAFMLVMPPLFTDFSTALGDGIGILFETEGIAETQSIFARSLGIVAAPITLFGLAAFLTVPYLLWSSWFAVGRHEPAWLVPTTYAWFFFILSLLQIRFAGQLSLFIAVFAGLGMIHLLAWIDLVRAPRSFVDAKGPGSLLSDPSIPDDNNQDSDSKERRDFMRTAGVIVAIGGLGALLTPLKHSQVTIARSEYRAASAMSSYATEKNLEYPRNYVLSRWGLNRMYNYFVSGRSLSFVYARRTYDQFITSTDPTAWYEQLRDRVGFVVTEDLPSLPEATIHQQLHSDWARSTNHYRALYTTPNGSLKAFALVPGTYVAGKVDSESDVLVETRVSIPNAEFNYQRTGVSAENGWVAIQVQYPGTYYVGNRKVWVDETDISDGGFAGEKGSRARWDLTAGSGNTVFDPVGGYHGFLQNADWGRAEDRLLISLGADGFVEVPGGSVLPTDGGFTVSVWVQPASDVNYRTERPFPRLLTFSPSGQFEEVPGAQLAMDRGRLLGAVGSGDGASVLRGPSLDDGSWHQASLSWDGSSVRLYLDGQLVAEGLYDDQIDTDRPLIIGGLADGRRTFAGAVMQARFEAEAVDDSKIMDWYDSSPFGS